MASGGARSRSGPPFDPTSLRSTERGIKLTPLPSEGYSGDVPNLAEYLSNPTARHEAIWAEYWSTPQACWWATQPFRWSMVADLVEIRARADDPNSAATLWSAIRQLKTDLALNSDGLRREGLSIAQDEIAKRATEHGVEPKRSSARDRIRVVNGDGA